MRTITTMMLRWKLRAVANRIEMARHHAETAKATAEHLGGVVVPHLEREAAKLHARIFEVEFPNSFNGRRTAH